MNFMKKSVFPFRFLYILSSFRQIYRSIFPEHFVFSAQLAGARVYTDCLSAEGGKTPPQRMS